MKRTALFDALLALTGTALAYQYVNGYTRKDGTHVQGYMKSSSYSNRYNNRIFQTYGGSQRDEYSSGTSSTYKSNSSYGWRVNDSDSITNPYDKKPDSKRGWYESLECPTSNSIQPAAAGFARPRHRLNLKTSPIFS